MAATDNDEKHPLQGKIHFDDRLSEERDEEKNKAEPKEGNTRGEITTAHYYRLRGDIDCEAIQRLVDTYKGNKCSVHVHCIDYDHAPSNISRLYGQDSAVPTAHLHDDTDDRESEGPRSPRVTIEEQEKAERKRREDISVKIQKDLLSLWTLTDGVFLTWCGRHSNPELAKLSGQTPHPGDTMHEVLLSVTKEEHLQFEEKEFARTFVTLAHPAWDDLRDPQGPVHPRQHEKPQEFIRDKLNKGSQDHVVQLGARGSDPLGRIVSPYATHFVFLGEDVPDHPLGSEYGRLSTRDRSQMCTEFLQKLVENIEEFGDEESSARPVVCLLMNGATDALKTVKFAMDRNIPVIVMKGTGGYADLIAYLYSHTKRVTKRERDGDKVITRSVKEVDRGLLQTIKMRLRRERAQDVDLMDDIIKRLDRLTIYEPQKNDNNRCLDALILDSLLKHKKERTVEFLLAVMERNKTQVPNDLQHRSKGVIEDEALQISRFIDAVLKNKPVAVTAFLDKLEIPLNQLLHMGYLLYLYRNSNVLDKLSCEKKKKQQDKKGTDTPDEEQMQQVGKEIQKYRRQWLQCRQKLQKHFGDLPMFPLHCTVKGCKACSCTPHIVEEEEDVTPTPGVSQETPHPDRNDDVEGPSTSTSETIPLLEVGGSRSVAASPGTRAVCDPGPDLEVKYLKYFRTCLHPVQELFLWSLMAQRIDMAVAFWNKCEDRMAAALFAHQVFSSMAKEEKDLDKKTRLQEHASRFQTLAINTLNACHELDEAKTELLLRKKCPWWGECSVLQLAICTENRTFLAQTACQELITRIWAGKPPRAEGEEEALARIGSMKSKHLVRPCGFRDGEKHRYLLNMNISYSKLFNTISAPIIRYWAAMILQLVFLALFSYALVIDFGLDTDVSWTFIAVIIWVVDIAFEELRQAITVHKSTVVGDAAHTMPLWRRIRLYWAENWNKIDLATIVFFLAVIPAFSGIWELHIFGRVVLSVDVFLFFLRFIQMLLVFPQLGLMVAMVPRMVKDAVYFMIILLTFIMAYAVASECILYPDSQLSAWRLFHVPRKAFWQVFGELFLDDIEKMGNDTCKTLSDPDSQHHGGNDVPCPSRYGRYMVPFMLAIYLIITQVLLLNLLIAQFGVTFGEVREKAKEYQSWHRCQIVREFYNRQPLVPPFQILRCIRKVVKYVNNRHCPRRSSCCCCGNSQSKEEDRNKLVLKTSGYDTCVKLDWYTVQNGSGVEIGWDKEGRYKTHQLVILTMDENMHVMQQDCFTLAKLTPTIQHMTFWRTDPRFTLAAYVGRRKSADEMKTDQDNAKKCRQMVIDPNKWLQFATEDHRERRLPKEHLESIEDHITIFETKAFEEEQVAWVLAKEEEMAEIKQLVEMSEHQSKDTQLLKLELVQQRQLLHDLQTRPKRQLSTTTIATSTDASSATADSLTATTNGKLAASVYRQYSMP